MRKSLISLTTFILLVTIFVSCSKEETKETPPPTISFLTGIHPGSGLPYITKDTSLVKGTKFAFGIAASTGSGDNLKRLLIKGNFENVSYRTLIDTTFDSPSITYDSTNFAYTGDPGNEDFEFTVWDKNDQSATIGFTITTEPEPPSIKEYEGIILGAQANTTGSSFATENGNVYTIEEAKINSEQVDFLYFFLAPNNATLAAPNDATAMSIFTGANGLSHWAVRNPTKFKLTNKTSDDFDDIQSSQQISAICNAVGLPNLTILSNLEPNKVILFQTHDDLFGLIRIDAITGENNAGTIEISVKVQQAK